MALKPLRNTVVEDISMYMNQVAERGRIVIFDTSVSGLGDMDDAGNLCKVPTDSGGAPVGILMCDMVDVDLSKFHLNAHQDEVQKNSKVTIMQRGFVRTNCITGTNPVPGSGAYFTTSGNLTMTNNSTQVGTFHSAIDADGYVKVAVKL